MVWFRVCDTMYAHPKTFAAGNEALGLWVRAGSWAGQQLSNGAVPKAIVEMCGTAEQAKLLVSAGLWVPTKTGYVFHDWEDNQRSREQVEAARKADRERQARRRHGVTPDVSHGGSNGVVHSVTHGAGHAGIPVRTGSSSRSKDPYRDSGVSHGVTPTPPKIADLCDHGRDGTTCPYCRRRQESR